MAFSLSSKRSSRRAAFCSLNFILLYVSTVALLNAHGFMPRCFSCKSLSVSPSASAASGSEYTHVRCCAPPTPYVTSQPSVSS